MTKERLAAFSDGVFAIIITIMVLELKVPHGETFAALAPLLPIFLSYVLSFVYVAIYWNNYHHMLYVTERVSGAVLWANTNLLFWLSLLPFSTGWMGENHFAPAPTAVYGINLLCAGIAYWVLQNAIIAMQGKNSVLATAIGRDFKGKASPPLYIASIVFAFVSHWVAHVIFVAVALMWLLPDRRIERAVFTQTEKDSDKADKALE